MEKREYGKRREVIIKVMLSQGEKEAYERLAGKQSLSAWVRAVLAAEAASCGEATSTASLPVEKAKKESATVVAKVSSRKKAGEEEMCVRCQRIGVKIKGCQGCVAAGG